MTELTLKDGRIFTSRFHDIKTAIDDVNDYLFCEYNERITVDDISNIKTSSDGDICEWLIRTHKVYTFNNEIKIETPSN